MDQSAAEEPEALTADIVNVSGGAIQNVAAETVHIRQGGAKSISAESVALSRGGAGLVSANTVEIRQSAALTVRSDQTTVESGVAAAVVAQEFHSANSRVGLAIADRAELSDSPTLILLARQVDGEVNTVLDTRGALLAGLTAGLAVGLMLLAGNFVFRRR
ncbi:MAG: hypothetical protein AB1449_14215 [Chloroflexota bacterium]